jgi:hypothetical protein
MTASRHLALSRLDRQSAQVGGSSSRQLQKLQVEGCLDLAGRLGKRGMSVSVSFHPALLGPTASS